jgi:hypothetical protein
MIEKRIGIQKRIGTPSARPIIRTGAGYAVVNNPNYEGLTLLSHHLCVCRCGTMKTQRLVPFRSVPFVIVVRVLCSHGGDFFLSSSGRQVPFARKLQTDEGRRTRSLPRSCFHSCAVFRRGSRSHATTTNDENVDARPTP